MPPDLTLGRFATYRAGLTTTGERLIGISTSNGAFTYQLDPYARAILTPQFFQGRVMGDGFGRDVVALSMTGLFATPDLGGHLQFVAGLELGLSASKPEGTADYSVAPVAGVQAGLRMAPFFNLSPAAQLTFDVTRMADMTFFGLSAQIVTPSL